MKLTIRRLRRIIREAGLDSDMRNMAGSFDGGVSSSHRDRESSLVNAPPGLGDEQHNDEEDDETDEPTRSQFAARVDARRPR